MEIPAIPRLLLPFVLAWAALPAGARDVRCATSAQLAAALADARPGDRIRVAPGIYVSTSTAAYALPHAVVRPWFHAAADGTAEAPIVLEAEDPSDPPALEGADPSEGYLLWITGDRWEVRNLALRKAAKGVMVDNADFVRLFRLDVSEIGEEGIHLRDGSSDCVVESTAVTLTGRSVAGYGEAVYIGSDRGKWDVFDPACHRNRIVACSLGPYVTAEHVDIKEGTLGTVVERCKFHGSGITGANSADGFVDAKGNGAAIRDNWGRQEGAPLKNAFQTHSQVEGWGLDNVFSGNTVHFDDTLAWMVDSPSGSALVAGNTRFPEGNMYRGKFTRTDRPRIGNHLEWDRWTIFDEGDTVAWKGRVWAAKFYTVGAEPGGPSDTRKAWLDLGPNPAASLRRARRDGASGAPSRSWRADGKRLPPSLREDMLRESDFFTRTGSGRRAR